MKVLQVSKYFPPVFGGIETVAWELTHGLNRRGVPTEVLCANQVLHTARETAPGGYGVTRAASMGTWMSASMAPAMAVELARLAPRADLLHVHMPDPTAAWAVWVCRPRAHLVVHWHSDVIRQRLALRAYEPLQRWLLGRAAAVIATSDAYADASPPLQAWREKVRIVPIGITDVAEQACALRTAQLRERFGGRRIVFALGRMTYYKGFDLLIRAAAQLPPDVVLVIGGDGELLESYRELARALGLADRVRLIGHVADEDLSCHFEACEVFCMSSTVRAEAYGVAMLEAMMMGKPVVATDIAGSGVPWVNVHGSTGLNVEPGSADALAGALNRLLQHGDLRAACGRRARERYLAEFRAERMIDRTLALYRELSSR